MDKLDDIDISIKVKSYYKITSIHNEIIIKNYYDMIILLDKLPEYWVKSNILTDKELIKLRKKLTK